MISAPPFHVAVAFGSRRHRFLGAASLAWNVERSTVELSRKGKYGGMAAWQHGSMAAWQYGSMEALKQLSLLPARSAQLTLHKTAYFVGDV
jgi:hypothetical protein